MNKIAVALAAFAMMTSSAFAAEGPLMMRFRAVQTMFANESKAVGLTGTPTVSVPADKIEIQDKTIPELDFTYFFTPNIAAELILTYPQKHTVTVKTVTIGGATSKDVELGTVTELPPCLTAQWHFLPGAVANPYVGLGVNMTLITAQDLTAALPLQIKEKTSFGAVGQVGVDVKVADQVFINADVKYVTPMKYDVKLKDDVGTYTKGSKVTTVTLNPWLFGVGIGYRF